MSEKSHVGMGFTVCPVCGAEHDEVVLLNTQLRNTLSPRQAIGWGMCPEHQKLRDEGYIALIGTSNEPHSLNDAIRTGELAHVRASVWPTIFNTPVPEKGICFVQSEVIQMLKGIPVEGS